MKLKIVFLSVLIFNLGCTAKGQLKKTLEENPDIVLNMIEKHPLKFMEAFNKAAGEARKEELKKNQAQEAQALEDEFNNPKKPVVDNKRAWGKADAAITIVEYSDFQCPFCKRGADTMEEVVKKYGDKVRIVYKHLPLPFHQEAELAAQYYEAIAMQDMKKAKKFHDLIFAEQPRIKSEKEKFLNAMAKKAGANLSKVKKNLKSKKVKELIEADKAEAAKFGFSGTPGFLVNGVSVRGAFPFAHFEKIIDRHLQK